MKISYKLVTSYTVITLLTGVVGFFGLSASKQIVKSFEGGEKHFRSIVAAATEVSSNAKAAESHIMLYVTLYDVEDKDQFFARLNKLQELVNALHEQVKMPEAMNILEQISSNTAQIRSIGKFLISTYENETKTTKHFDLEKHRDLLLELYKTTSSVRRNGIALARFETDFLNRQEAITAATEANSYATRAAGHLMLYLMLNDPIDREKFYARTDSLRAQISVLSERLKDPKARDLLAAINVGSENILSSGTALLDAYDKDLEKQDRFVFDQHRGLIQQLRLASYAVRDNATQLAALSLAIETEPKEIAARYAADLQRNIIAAIIVAILLSLVLGYAIARNLSGKITKLKNKAAEIGKGNLDIRLDIRSQDEIGDLSRSCNEMVRDLQKMTVSRDYMNSIITSMINSLIVLSPAGAVELVNPATCELLGYRKDELINEPAERIFEGKSLPNGVDLEMLMKEKTVSGVETTYRARNGTRIPVIFSGSIMQSPDGAVNRIVCVAQDITVRKRMEEELIKSEKLQSVGVLAGGIAHDFNNLLTIASGNIELLKSLVKLEDEGSDALLNAEKALHRAEKLTYRLLTFSKGGAPLKKSINVGELIKESTGFAASGSKVKCECVIPDDIWPVEIDEGQVSQVINNMVINAIQSMPQGGTIKVNCKNITLGPDNGYQLKAGDYLQISISDQGTGIARKNLKRIFDPYFTTKDTGNGLGLSVCYSVIKNHEGHIAVESGKGHGTTFFIYLPASHHVKIGNEEKRKELIKGMGRILIMDDEESVRNLLGNILSRLGYEPMFARDGKEMIELYKEAQESGAPCAAVIMDLTVPGGMGGKEGIESLRKLDPYVKAIVSSGYSNDPVMAEYKKYGFCGILTKPYRIKVISETLYRVIQSETLPG